MIAPDLLAKPRSSRPAVAGVELVIPPPDPIRELRRRLERAYLERLTVSPAQVSRFLEQRIPPFGEMPASSMWIDTVDDFLAFEALRMMAAGGFGAGDDTRLARQLRGRFALAADPGQAVENAWICAAALWFAASMTVSLWSPAMLVEFATLEERNPRGFQRATQLIFT